jgi:hypothetical protein
MPLGLFGLFIPPGRGNDNAVGSFGLCCRITYVGALAAAFVSALVVERASNVNAAAPFGIVLSDVTRSCHFR